MLLWSRTELEIGDTNQYMAKPIMMRETMVARADLNLTAMQFMSLKMNTYSE